MNLLMISGDRSILQGKKGAFYYMLEEFSTHWERVDVICPIVRERGKGKREREPSFPSSPFPFPLFGKVYFHPSPHGLWYQPRWIVQQGKKLIAEHNHAVMAVHEYPPFYNGFGAEWLSRKTGVPYAMEVHHIVGYPKAASFTELIGRWTSHLFLVNDSYGAKAIRCVNRGTATVLERWGARRGALFIIPSFYLDTEMLSNIPHGAKTFDVVVSGRMVANKCFGDVLRAVATLPTVTLLLIGDGPKRKRWERLARTLHISDRTEFCGWLPESTDVYRAIASAKVLVMNSKSEGGPRIALEAMALGMPVITTKVGVMPDVIHDGENGLLTTGTPKNLAEKIEKVLKYPATRDQLGREAQKITKRFERTKLIKRYAEFLQSLAQ